MERLRNIDALDVILLKYDGGGGKICPIEYSGNTDIVKLGIALYDQNDFLVDLNGEGIIVTFNADQKRKEQYNDE